VLPVPLVRVAGSPPCRVATDQRLIGAANRSPSPGGFLDPDFEECALRRQPVMSDGSFEVSHRRLVQASVLDVRAELDLTHAPTLGVAVHRALGANPKPLVIDLCGVKSVDARGLAVLLSARRRSLRAGVELRLCLRHAEHPATACGGRRTGLFSGTDMAADLGRAGGRRTRRPDRFSMARRIHLDLSLQIPTSSPTADSDSPHRVLSSLWSATRAGGLSIRRDRPGTVLLAIIAARLARFAVAHCSPAVVYWLASASPTVQASCCMSCAWKCSLWKAATALSITTFPGPLFVALTCGIRSP